MLANSLALKPPGLHSIHPQRQNLTLETLDFLALNHRERLGVLWLALCVRVLRSIMSLQISSWDLILSSLNNRLQKVSQERKLNKLHLPCFREQRAETDGLCWPDIWANFLGNNVIGLTL